MPTGSPASTDPSDAAGQSIGRQPAPACCRLPDHPDLGWLRRQAKDLRRQAAAGDPEAVALIARYDPGPEPVTLARAQRVVARAFGFAGWSRLREHLVTLEEWGRDMALTGDQDDAVDEFLRAACLTYTVPYDPDRAHALLRNDPGLAAATAATMAVCGAAAGLAELLRRDPEAARRPTGPHDWPPLLYLCYGRLDAGDPVATLRVLLDAGADPNAGFLWQRLPSAFTALTGVLGGGERDEPAHPAAEAMARMLLDAGADPNDNQAFYNREFRPDDTHLQPLLSHGAGRAHPSPWRERLGSAYPSPAEMVGEHLRSAAAAGFIERVRVLLAHGVDPNTRGYHPILGDQTAYEVAVRHGQAEAAALLADAGGRSDRLDAVDLLLAAALGGDAATVDRLRSHAPELVTRRPDAVRLAGEQHGVSAIHRLLELGFGINTTGSDGRTALHEAALRGDEAACSWLLDFGADPARRDRDFDATPADWAAHAGHDALAARLRTGVSRA